VFRQAMGIVGGRRVGAKGRQERKQEPGNWTVNVRSLGRVCVWAKNVRCRDARQGTHAEERVWVEGQAHLGQGHREAGRRSSREITKFWEDGGVSAVFMVEQNVGSGQMWDAFWCR